jgi:hypothetical protein
MKFETGQLIVHRNTQSRWIVLGTKPYEPNETKRTKHQSNLQGQALSNLFDPQNPFNNLNTGRIPPNDDITMVAAYCIYSGDKPDYWQPNQLDHWMMDKENSTQYDKLWVTYINS